MSPRAPRHHQATTYARSGLFKGLSAFSELERRIEQLPTEKERGDAFEVFVEAHLNTDETAQADEVWVTANVPPEIRHALNLPSSDYGYDGVFRTRLGELVAWQAKFRTGRTALPYRELSTFFGITEKAERRVVITNSVGIAEVAKSRTNFNATRGTDFDRLDAAQLALIAAWIEGTPTPRQVREPLPHQRAALYDIASELAAHDRATVVMACGTGKTLVALWAAERQEVKRVLVLVPSLNLLRQTLHEWAKWTNWGERFRYLCVCSDPKVGSGLDEIEIRPEDTDFPVRTDPAIVRQFLDADDGAVSVVFCTYQSAPVVGEALRHMEPFDLGIFDEAHKTTGRESTRYGFALKDKNLPIKKRLFLTATPRHVDIRKRDQEGDFAVVSMNDEAVYGRVAHRLTFAQAADQKIIVPYKVVISVVDSDMIDNALLDQSEVSIKGDPVRAKWVAHQIALTRAVEEHDVKRIITFHSSIRAAAAFASDDSAGVGFHLPAFQRFHVSGVQPTAERDGHMRAFARVPRGVITNARCLTEGVDVPSVDMVAFMNPKRSRVDIVQAVGRAMRTSGDGKTCGYVLIPLFLELRQGESLTEALARSDFDEIAQVLNAMRDNDEELSEIIQALSVDKGRTGGFDESRLRDKVEVLGPQIQLNELATAIRTLLINELGVTWDERFGQLITYKETYGDCLVPARWKSNPELASWCGTQRKAYKNESLTPYRAARLQRLGFVWDPFAAAWEQKFAELSDYIMAHGSSGFLDGFPDNSGLNLWCVMQRQNYKNNQLAQDRITRLEQLGFLWDPYAVSWNQYFAQLADYKQAHGNCNVPEGWKEDPEFARWCAYQRKAYRGYRTISPNRIALLEDLGFVWDPYAAAWEQMFIELTAYKLVHGDCNVPQRLEGSLELAEWCRSQRRAFKGKKLSVDRIARLEQLGFVWDQLIAEWEHMFAELIAYKLAHGDCNVPQKWADNPKLGIWCSGQRQAYKANELSADRIARLDQLGFIWNKLETSWEQMIVELTSYKQAHGDCKVPRNWADNPALAVWCHNQRGAHARKKLSPDRIARLEQLGFVWDSFGLAWEQMFAELAAYKQTYGDCNVPNRWADNPQLGSWCSNQKGIYKSKQLSSDRITRLEQLGFLWSPRKNAWDAMLAELATYKQAYGDCNVPQRWPANPKLGKWCSQQRMACGNNMLATDRVKKLREIGFQFRVHQPKK